MSVAVKICGIKTRAALETALDGGADYVGLVFFAKSPRNLDLSTAAGLAQAARGRAKVVALVVDPDDVTVGEIVAAVGPDMLQLHGSETPERVAEIRARFGLPVMKAIKVATAADAAAALDFKDAADLVLFDAKAPKSLTEALPGGNGLPFDWTLLDGVKQPIDFMLSGGLNPENVAEAIRLTGAKAVDVSSGVESRPGEKDLALIGRFLQAAKTAKQAA